MKLIVVGEGYERFAYEYLMDISDAFGRHNWPGAGMLDYPEYIDWIQNKIARNTIIVYIKRPDGQSSLMKQYLDRNLEIRSDRPTTIIYSTQDSA